MRYTKTVKHENKKAVILITVLAVVLLVVAGFIIFRDKIFFAYDKDGIVYEQTTENEQTGDE